MSDEWDRACPLCAEEMDLTDQQLKPCKCGYEICVWCWHHIMDMAEKDQTQGRCPACRTPYNKEKVVSTAANCERLVAEMNMEKKMKSQKTKSKISDGRKQLGSVRVIQKSLVYIVGLPLTLADESLLQQRDYFGQYGRVLKVSISRTAAGSIQQFPNNTCSVYITYSKEEEAVRCIQSVHGFVLEDRPLRACFGTTKYCHAWLRNVPCSNPDCLYLHEIGTQEDSFTKDEIISAYTRVQQITGVTSNMQHRSGNVLPPPADDCHISSSTLSGKPTNQSSSNNIATSVNGSMPNSSSARSVALPSAASWGARASKGNPPSDNIACPKGPTKQKSEMFSGSASSAAFSAAAAGTVQVPSMHAETRKKLINNEESQNKQYKGGQEPMKSSRQVSCVDSDTAHDASVHIHRVPSPNYKERYAQTSPFETTFMESVGGSCYRGPENDLNVAPQGNNSKLSFDIKTMNITGLFEADHSGDNRPHSSLSVSADVANLSLNQGLQGHMLEVREPAVSISLGQTVSSTDDSRVTKEKSGHRPEFLARRQPETESYFQAVGAKLDSQVASPRVRPRLQSLKGEKRDDSEMTSTSYFAAPPLPLHHSDLSSVHSPTHIEPYGSSSLIQDSPLLVDTVDNGLLSPGISAANAEHSVATDMGESHMISNILSLDFDPWEESLTSPQNLFKLLSEGDKHPRSLAPSSSWKAQNSNKSRFSFARPDECGDLPSNVEPSFSHMQQVFKESPSTRDFAVNRGCNFDKFVDCSGFSSFNNGEPDTLAGSYSYLPTSKFSGSRSQVSAPPGFSSPNKAPPPGFTSHERVGPNFDSVSGTPFLDTSSFLRNPYHSPQTEHNGTGTDMDASFLRNSYHSPQTVNIGSSTDIEFMDPAILAVGKGRFPIGLNHGAGFDMSSNLSPQLNAIENDIRFQSLMQRSSPLVQNLRISGTSNGFGPVNETHNDFSSRIMEQTLASNLSPFSQLSLQQSRTSMMPNGPWNGLGEGKSEMGMAELLRTESLFNKFYGGYENSKFRMPSSGDIYNRTYGI